MSGVRDVALAVRARRAAVGGEVKPATVGVADGVIASVGPYDAGIPAGEVVELAPDEVLLPGLVDTHVHVNEPGRTGWEGFATATRAAAAGGVTTIVDMPLNSIPPTTDVPALEAKRAAAAGQAYVDVGFWGGAVPGNLADLAPLHEAGGYGFKCFLADSGVEEFPPLSPGGLDEVLAEVARLGALLVVHAEDAATLAAAPAPVGRSYAAFLASRPAEAEVVAVRRLVDGARRTGARVHVLHLSAASAVPVLREAQRLGVRVTAETCPHYLTFAAEQVPDGATPYKCCPPIRDAGNRDVLWRALADGVVGLVVSDHSPCPPGLKHLDDGDLGAAWGGISSLQLGLPVLWTAARGRGYGLADVVRWMSTAPAALAGLDGKGRIAVGGDADLVAFAPDERWVVDPAALHHRHPVTPYAGCELTGAVRRTWLRGREIGAEPHGRLLTRGGARP